MSAIIRETLTIPADLAYCKRVREFVRSGGVAAGLPEDRIGDLLVAVCEAVANAIEHGSPQGPKNKVEVRCENHSKKFEVRVRDEGLFKKALALSDHGPRGRGVFLMLALTDKVVFNEASEGTTVHLFVDIPSSGPSPP